ncbi:MAG: hypothetical protein AB1726_11990 [Planctomycetota bacterium]
MTFLWGASIIPFLVLATSLHAAEAVTFQNARYLTDSGELYPLTGPDDVPGEQPGLLIAEFPYQATGPGPIYPAPLLSLTWTVSGTNTQYISAFVAPGWHDPALNGPFWAAFTSFNPFTGAGQVQVRVPFGKAADNGQRFALLPEDSALVTIAVGNAGNLALDASGQPVNVTHTGALAPVVSYPDTWIDFYTPGIGPGASGTGMIYSRVSSQTERSYLLIASPPGMVEVETNEFLSTTDGQVFLVQMPAGLLAAAFDARALQPGQFTFQMTELDGTPLATSQVCETVDGHSIPESEAYDAFGFPKHPGMTVHVLIPEGQGPEGDPFDYPLETNWFNSKCYPARPSTSYPYMRSQCSECSNDPQPPAECDADTMMVYFKPASCAWTASSSSSCFYIGYTTFSVPTYDMEGAIYEQPLGCPEWEMDGDGELHKGFWGLLFSGGTRIQTYKMCCWLKRNKSRTQEVCVKQCSDQPR